MRPDAVFRANAQTPVPLDKRIRERHKRGLLAWLAAASVIAESLSVGAAGVAQPLTKSSKLPAALPEQGMVTPRGALRDFVGDQIWHNSYPAEPINGHVIEKIRAVCATSCIWFGRESSGGVVRDAELTRAGLASWRKIDAGIRIGGSKGGVATSGILIERVYSHGWRQAAHKGYANGDGIVANRGVRDVTIRDSRLDDNADGGLDTKADLTVLDNVSASGNGHYGFRFWGGVKAGTLTCIDNAWGCIEAEDGADVTIDRLVMTGAQELVTTKPGAVVAIRTCDLSGWTGTDLTKGTGKVTLGSGCSR